MGQPMHRVLGHWSCSSHKILESCSVQYLTESTTERNDKAADGLIYASGQEQQDIHPLSNWRPFKVLNEACGGWMDSQKDRALDMCCIISNADNCSLRNKFMGLFWGCGMGGGSESKQLDAGCKSS